MPYHAELISGSSEAGPCKNRHTNLGQKFISDFVVTCMAQCCEQGPRKLLGLKSCRRQESLPHFHHPARSCTLFTNLQSHQKQACEALDYQ